RQRDDVVHHVGQRHPARQAHLAQVVGALQPAIALGYCCPAPEAGRGWNEVAWQQVGLLARTTGPAAMTDNIRDRLEERIAVSEASWRQWSNELIEIRRALSYSDERPETTRRRMAELIDLIEAEIGVFEAVLSVLDESDDLAGSVYAAKVRLVA